MKLHSRYSIILNDADRTALQRLADREHLTAAATLRRMIYSALSEQERLYLVASTPVPLRGWEADSPAARRKDYFSARRCTGNEEETSED